MANLSEFLIVTYLRKPGHLAQTNNHKHERINP
jgi:hypothetical protein